MYFMIRGTLSKQGQQWQCLEARNVSFLSLYFIKCIFTLVTVYVSIFAEITLTPASPGRNDGYYFLRCRPRFEDRVEMEHLKSHLRAGRHKSHLYFT